MAIKRNDCTGGKHSPCLQERNALLLMLAVFGPEVTRVAAGEFFFFFFCAFL